MKFANQHFSFNPVFVAVRLVILTMGTLQISAYAAEELSDEALALVTPTHVIEAGVSGVSGATDKSGEYNGLARSGAHLLGGFKLSGGDTYGLGTGTARWRLSGSDLGSPSRNITADYSEQGAWSVGFEHDELRHYTGNGDYRTPFSGAMGGNVFRWDGPLISQGSAVPESSYTGQSVHTDRKSNGFTAEYNITPSLNWKFELKRIEQSGAKLISAASDTSIWSAPTVGSNFWYFKGSGVVTLMNPTEYKTDTFDLSVNWNNDRGYWTASYFASIFENGYNGISWDNPYYAKTAVTGPAAATIDLGTAKPMLNSMGTSPSNQFHQLNFHGGYKFNPETKLVGGISYSRNTQDQNYDGSYTASLLGVNGGRSAVSHLPYSSLDGLIVTTNANLKLTHQLNKDLELAAAYRFNERDNRTASGLYEFTHIGSNWYQTSGTTTVGAPSAAPTEEFLSIPMSNKRTQFDLSSDYKIDSNHRVRVSLENERVQRWCNTDPSTEITGVSSNCSQVSNQKETKINLAYRGKTEGDVAYSVGYTSGDRDATINKEYYNPGTQGSVPLVSGYVAFFQASRKQDVLKGSVNWQASESLDLGVRTRYSSDDYGSAFGVQGGHTTGLDLDAAYQLSDTNVVTAFVSFQKQSRDLYEATSQAKVTFWNNTLTNQDRTFGISAHQNGLYQGQWNFDQNLTYSNNKSGYSTVLSGTALTGSSLTNFGTSGDAPDITTRLLQLRLGATNVLNKNDKVVYTYVYQKLKTNDYFYNFYSGTTNVGTATVLPTFQEAPSYTNQVVGVLYVHNFK